MCYNFFYFYNISDDLSVYERNIHALNLLEYYHLNQNIEPIQTKNSQCFKFKKTSLGDSRISRIVNTNYFAFLCHLLFNFA